MKATIFQNNEQTNVIISVPKITTEECKENLKHIHTTITSQYLSSRKKNKVTNITPNDIHSSEQTLPQYWHNSEPTNHYFRKVTDIMCSEPESYMSQCPLCMSPTHETNLFYCSQVLTQYNTISLEKGIRSSRGNPKVGI